MTSRLVLFDLDDVLCHYDRPARVAELAALAARPVAEIEAAIWNSGFEDQADRGAFTAENYLWEFGKRLGFWITREAWVENRRAAMTPWPEMLALVERVKARARVGLFTANGPLMKAELAKNQAAIEGMDARVAAANTAAREIEDQIFTKNQPPARKYALKRVK